MAMCLLPSNTVGPGTPRPAPTPLGRSAAAVCHGPCGLTTAKDANGDSILKGRQVGGSQTGRLCAREPGSGPPEARCPAAWCAAWCHGCTLWSNQSRLAP